MSGPAHTSSPGAACHPPILISTPSPPGRPLSRAMSTWCPGSQPQALTCYGAVWRPSCLLSRMSECGHGEAQQGCREGEARRALQPHGERLWNGWAWRPESALHPTTEPLPHLQSCAEKDRRNSSRLLLGLRPRGGRQRGPEQQGHGRPL